MGEQQAIVKRKRPRTRRFAEGRATFTFDADTLDVDGRRVRLGKELRKLLAALCRKKAGTVYTRAELMGRLYVNDSLLTANIGRLRRIIRNAARGESEVPDPIITVQGTGYALFGDANESAP